MMVRVETLLILVCCYAYTTAKFQLSHPRCCVFASSYQGRYALFAGGYGVLSNQSIWPYYNLVEMYDASTNDWSVFGSLSLARGCGCACVCLDVALFAGGFAQTGWSRVVDIYNFTSKEWSVTELPDMFTSPSASCVGNKAFFTDGSFVDVYDLISKEWASIPSPGGVSQGAVSTSINGRVFIAGGVAGRSYSNTMNIYNYETNQWTNTTIPQPRSFLSAISYQYEGQAFALFAGGQTPGLVYSCDVYIYDVVNRNWKEPGRLSVCRDMITVTAAGEYIFFAGGWYSTFGEDVTGETDTVDIYNYVRGTWSSVRLSASFIYIGATSVTVGKKMAIFAGGYNWVTFDTVQFFTVCSSDSDCSDNIYCNGNDYCNQTAQTCSHTGDPCAVGSLCNNLCNETLKTCTLPNQTPCGTSLCFNHKCNGNGQCIRSLTYYCQIYFIVAVSIIAGAVSVLLFIYFWRWLKYRYYVKIPQYSTNLDATLQMIMEDNSITKLDPKSLVQSELIGSGGQGVVFKGTYKDREVAIKTLARFGSDSDAIDFAREVTLISQLKHENIVEFIGVMISIEKQAFSLVTELLDTPLNNKEVVSRLSLTQKLRIAKSVASGMRYLHGHKPPVLHRDLKPGNVLLSYDGRCKITDFGVSRVMPWKTATITQYSGTIMYMAPEVFESTHYNEKADIYSFGILFAELMHSGDIYPGIPVHFSGLFMNKLKSGEITPLISPTCPKEIREIISRCISLNPSGRPSFDEICEVL